MSGLAEELGRPVSLIAESDLNDPRLVRAAAAGGYGLDAMWADDFHHALHAILSVEHLGYYEDFGTVAHLAKAPTKGFVYDGRALGARRHGRSLEVASGSRLVVFIQNHDQIGNRACGDRFHHLADFEAAKVAGAIPDPRPVRAAALPGAGVGLVLAVPYVTDHDDPELGRAVSEGRRREFAAFGWTVEQIPGPAVARHLRDSS